MDFIIRPGLEGDEVALRDFAAPYFHESIYSREGLVYCPDTTLKTFAVACAHPMLDTIIVDEKQVLAGVAIVCYNSSFFKGYEGNIDFYYVSPAYRGTGAARLLAKACQEAAKERKANVLYCGCHSGFSDDGANNQLYANLFKKIGFVVNGTNLQWFNGEILDGIPRIS